MLEIADPLADEVTWGLERSHELRTCFRVDDRHPVFANNSLLQSENIAHLCREDGQGYTCCEADDDGIRDELDDCAELEHTHEDEEHTGKDGGNGETKQTVFRIGDNAIDDDDEGTGRTTDLNLRTS